MPDTVKLKQQQADTARPAISSIERFSMRSMVTTLAAELVTPSEATPSATLPLSSVDHAMGLRFMVEMITVYSRGSAAEPSKVIRDALSKALVPYYPVAGRLVTSGDGLAEVACTGDGVWFVEAATSHYGVGDLEDLQLPLTIPKEELLPSPPSELNQEEMILMMQVTKFNCGGYTIGVKFNHLVFDGIGAGQIFRAIAYICGGLARPAVTPVWSRDALPAPPRHPRSHPAATFHFVQSLCDFPLATIYKIKEDLTRETSHRCTTFDVVAALLWQSRTRAIGLSGGDLVHLVFPANVRALLRGVLPREGAYYGNCLYFLTVTATSERIKRARLAEVVGLIRDAKASMPRKVAEWAAGEFREDPYIVPIGYEALNLSDWRSLGFYEVDHGWGMPRAVAPLNDHAFFAGGILLRPPTAKQGVRFTGQVVVKEHEEIFVNEMKRYM